MSLRRLLYLVLVNCTLALGFLFAVLGTGEYIVPAFATPFIDLVHLALLVLALDLGALILRPTELGPTRWWTKVWQGLMLLLACAMGGVLLWASTGQNGGTGLYLLGLYGVLSLVFLIVTLG